MTFSTSPLRPVKTRQSRVKRCKRARFPLRSPLDAIKARTRRTLGVKINELARRGEAMFVNVMREVVLVLARDVHDVDAEHCVRARMRPEVKVRTLAPKPSYYP